MAPKSRIRAGKNTALSILKRREFGWDMAGSYLRRCNSVPEAVQKALKRLVLNKSVVCR
jgi:hypothetical protein